MVVSVAIVGSGPAGFYTANALVKACTHFQIDIIERLPTPYGLIRGGVAPDHQTTKRVAKKFEKTALFEEVNFYGNIEINKHVSLSQLRDIYDAVVLAVGAPSDRKLSIPGVDKYGVFGSTAFVGWYNGHPDFQDLNPCLNTESAVVVGNGNVALDCARILSRTQKAMAVTDLPLSVQNSITGSSITDVYVLGRRGPIEANFTNVELRELGQLSQAEPRVREEQLEFDAETKFAAYEGRDLRVRERNLNTLTEYAKLQPDRKPKRLHIEFFSQPVAVLGGESVEALRCERTQLVDGQAQGTGKFFEIPCGLVIAAIGYRADKIDGAPYDAMRGIVPNDEGRVAPGLYAVGWIKRGPTGVISSNRPDGEIVASHINEDTLGQGNRSKLGRIGLERLLRSSGHRWVTFRDWQYLDTLEQLAADGLAPRRKFVTIKAMLDALDAREQNK